MATKSATQEIKEWLEEGKPLTGLMAVQMFYVLNLSNIIYKLRKRGMNIVSTKRYNGSGHYYVEYSLNWYYNVS